MVRTLCGEFIQFFSIFATLFSHLFGGLAEPEISRMVVYGVARRLVSSTVHSVLTEIPTHVDIARLA